jgi:hypothetical protein
MTTKPKTRKAQSAKARAPKLVKQAVSEPSRGPFGLQPFALDVNKVEALAARFRWLEADQDYATAIAPHDADAGLRHEAEQDRIIAELRTLVPKDYYELAALFRFAIDGIQRDGGEIDMLQNVSDALPRVICDERKTALQKGMTSMREFLNKRTDLASRLASDPEIFEQIGRGSYD